MASEIKNNYIKKLKLWRTNLLSTCIANIQRRYIFNLFSGMNQQILKEVCFWVPVEVQKLCQMNFKWLNIEYFTQKASMVLFFFLLKILCVAVTHMSVVNSSVTVVCFLYFEAMQKEKKIMSHDVVASDIFLSWQASFHPDY